jgi:hypothetical protein
VCHPIAQRGDRSYNISIDYNIEQSLATYIEAHRTGFVVEGFMAILFHDTRNASRYITTHTQMELFSADQQADKHSVSPFTFRIVWPLPNQCGTKCCTSEFSLLHAHSD